MYATSGLRPHAPSFKCGSHRITMHWCRTDQEGRAEAKIASGIGRLNSPQITYVKTRTDISPAGFLFSHTISGSADIISSNYLSVLIRVLGEQCCATYWGVHSAFGKACRAVKPSNFKSEDSNLRSWDITGDSSKTEERSRFDICMGLGREARTITIGVCDPNAHGPFHLVTVCQNAYHLSSPPSPNQISISTSWSGSVLLPDHFRHTTMMLVHPLQIGDIGAGDLPTANTWTAMLYPSLVQGWCVTLIPIFSQ